MRATTLLERQHRNLQVLCEAIERGSPSARESLLPQLANDLLAHLKIEEELFYPAARVALGRTMEAFARGDHHSLARAYLEHLLDTPAYDQDFDTRISELRSVLEPHIEEEEESVFRRFDQAVADAENRALSARMMAVHHASVESFTPPPSSSRIRGSSPTLGGRDSHASR